MQLLSFLSTLATFFLFLRHVSAQSISIGAPLPLSSVSHGTNISVEVDKPVRRFFPFSLLSLSRPQSSPQNSISSSDSVAIVIALQSCSSFINETCDDRRQHETCCRHDCSLILCCSHEGNQDVTFSLGVYATSRAASWEIVPTEAPSKALSHRPRCFSDGRSIRT